MKKIEKLYSVDMIKELVPLSKYTIAEKVRAGEFGETVNVCRKHLVPESQLLKWMNEHLGVSPKGQKYFIPKPRSKKSNYVVPDKFTIKYFKELESNERRKNGT